MEPYGPFLLATAIGLFLAALTYLFGRKSGLQPAQASLIKTLQDNAEALNDQVDILKADLASERDRRVMLERKVDRMETIIVDLVDENADLRKKAGLPVRRTHPRIEGM